MLLKNGKNIVKSAEHHQIGDVEYVDVVLMGPLHSPRENQTTLVEFVLPSDYPFKPPSCRMRYISHPCVDSNGELAMYSLFKEDWSPLYTLLGVLMHLQQLFSESLTL